MKIAHISPHANIKVNKFREKKMDSHFEWNGHIFQADAKSLGFVSDTLLDILIDKVFGTEEIQTITWRKQDDTFYEFDVGEFVLFARALKKRTQEIMEESWALKDGLPNSV